MWDIPWLLFIATSLAVIMPPGQDLILVMSRGLGQGSKAGVIAALGVSTGLIGHTLLASIGLSALLTTSEIAFTVLKYIGEVYLLYIGIRLFFSGAQKLNIGTQQNKSTKRVFLEGAFCNISNPKITLFFFAFLPQFLPAHHTNPALGIFAMGNCFAILTFLLKSPIGFFAGRLSGWLQDHPKFLDGVFKFSGFALIAMALRLAFAEKV